MNIHNIKEYTQAKSPYYFSRDTLKFFGQTIKSFRVIKLKDENSTYFQYFIISKSGNNWREKHYSIMEFKLDTNDNYNSDLIRVDKETEKIVINRYLNN